MNTSKMNTASPNVKITRRGVKMQFEGKISFKDRLLMRLTSSTFWIDRVWYLFRAILLIGLCFVILYPFFTKIFTSFMAYRDFADPTVNMIPKHFSVEIYKQLAIDDGYWGILLNTTLLSAGTALVQTFICCMIGYGLAKFRFKGNKLIFIFVIITMAIPHSTLQLSMFQHFKNFDLFTIQSLNWKGIVQLVRGEPLSLLNSFAPFFVLSLTGLAFKNGLYIFMMRQFFQGVPDELEESAYVDGSGTFRTFFRIILPLSVPMMITIFLFSFSWQWTDGFYTKLFYPTTTDVPLMLNLIQGVPDALMHQSAYQTFYQEAIFNAGGLMIIAPLVIIYLFGQRYLIEGIERSGITG
ncbi:MAG: carbohydrate ABC transporter permease [Clostridia bacterium]|nr:carbohydrate ABC transporter permease [Clostridia bacterium]